MNNEILDTFGGDKVEVKSTFTNTPSIRIQNEDSDNVGAYVRGKFLLRRETPSKTYEGKMITFIELRYAASDKCGNITVKNGDRYDPVTPKVGEIISIMAPSRLARQAAEFEPGDDILILYEGMKKPTLGNGKKGKLGNSFQVRKKPGNLTPEDVEYIKKRMTPRDAKAVDPDVDVEAMAEAAAEAAGEALGGL